MSLEKCLNQRQLFLHTSFQVWKLIDNKVVLFSYDVDGAKMSYIHFKRTPKQTGAARFKFEYYEQIPSWVKHTIFFHRETVKSPCLLIDICPFFLLST